MGRTDDDTPPVPWLHLLLIGAVGIAVGGFIVNQRQRAHDAVVAVNGKVIDAPTFYHTLEITMDNRSRMTIGERTLRSMIDEQLRVQFAHEHHADPTETEVAIMLKGVLARPDVAARIRADKTALDRYRYKVLVDCATANVLCQGVTVTEDDARAYYRTNINPANPAAQYYTPDTRTVSVVLTRSQERIAQAFHALSSGSQFAQVVNQYSEAPNRASGGVIVIGRGRSVLQRTPGFEASILRMKPGDLLGPVQAGGLWWIVKCLDGAPASVVPYSAVRDECLFYARLAKGTALNDGRLKQEYSAFKRSSQIRVGDGVYSRVALPD